jgi:FlaA1/EpsC-like NDP-sugar epimerase
MSRCTRLRRSLLPLLLFQRKLHQIFEYLRPCDVRIRRLPLLSEMDKIHEMKVMDVDYDELLGRGGVVVDETRDQCFY